jgi:hypothetical protein
MGRVTNRCLALPSLAGLGMDPPRVARVPLSRGSALRHPEAHLRPWRASRAGPRSLQRRHHSGTRASLGQVSAPRLGVSLPHRLCLEPRCLLACPPWRVWRPWSSLSILARMALAPRCYPCKHAPAPLLGAQQLRPSTSGALDHAASGCGSRHALPLEAASLPKLPHH